MKNSENADRWLAPVCEIRYFSPSYCMIHTSNWCKLISYYTGFTLRCDKIHSKNVSSTLLDMHSFYWIKKFESKSVRRFVKSQSDSRYGFDWSDFSEVFSSSKSLMWDNLKKIIWRNDMLVRLLMLVPSITAGQVLMNLMELVTILIIQLITTLKNKV